MQTVTRQNGAVLFAEWIMVNSETKADDAEVILEINATFSAEFKQDRKRFGSKKVNDGYLW